MIVVKTENLVGTDREVSCPNGGFVSRRVLLESDKMGYTLTETHIPKGTPQIWHYINHLESCYCVSGSGRLVDLSTGEIHRITPGTVYILNDHDRHEFTAIEDTILVCVFNPPLKGREVHNEDGSYSG
jgi:L-ectoine synthase